MLGFTGFFWVLLGCTGLYWVVLGCTGLYWVLPGFAGVSQGRSHALDLGPGPSGFTSAVNHVPQRPRVRVLAVWRTVLRSAFVLLSLLLFFFVYCAPKLFIFIGRFPMARHHGGRHLVIDGGHFGESKSASFIGSRRGERRGFRGALVFVCLFVCFFRSTFCRMRWPPSCSFVGRWRTRAPQLETSKSKEKMATGSAKEVRPLLSSLERRSPSGNDWPQMKSSRGNGSVACCVIFSLEATNIQEINESNWNWRTFAASIA